MGADPRTRTGKAELMRLSWVPYPSAIWLLPLGSWRQGLRASLWERGIKGRIRTYDLMRMKHLLCQLSYSDIYKTTFWYSLLYHWASSPLVGKIGFEPITNGSYSEIIIAEIVYIIYFLHIYYKIFFIRNQIFSWGGPVRFTPVAPTGGDYFALFIFERSTATKLPIRGTSHDQ